MIQFLPIAPFAVTGYHWISLESSLHPLQLSTLLPLHVFRNTGLQNTAHNQLRSFSDDFGHFSF